jgi:large subunit ribosomal protein L6
LHICIKMVEEQETKVEEQKVEENIEEAPKADSRDKSKLHEEIEIPEGIIASVEEGVLIMKKEDKEIRRKLMSLIDMEMKGNKLIVKTDRVRKIERKLFGTFKAHVRNMIKGLTEGFMFKLKIANVHFPMNVSFDKTSNSVIVKNFLGEKTDRIITIPQGVEIKVDKEDIEIKGYDIEVAGDAATRIEKGTRVRNKDRRIYQDGIFIIEKPGRIYL